MILSSLKDNIICGSMKQQEIPYDVLEQEFIDELSKLGTAGIYQRGILATSSDDYVTARRMWFTPSGLTLYCLSTANMRKCDQIKANPNVAVVVGFVQYEGVASLMGHPLDEGNENYIESYKEKQPEKYESYKHNFVNQSFEIELIKIVPKRITLRTFKPDDGLDVLDVVNGKAYRFTDLDRVKVDHSDATAYRISQ
jgi:general stress protein 26